MTGRDRDDDQSVLFPDDEPADGDAGDLRYEGPVQYDDLEHEHDEPEAGGGAAKAFLTMAVVGGVVVLIVGAALWLRAGSSSDLAQSNYSVGAPTQRAATDRPTAPDLPHAAPEPAAPSAPAPSPTANARLEPSPVTPAGTGPTSPAPAQTALATPIRAVPETPRPAPAPASETRPAERTKPVEAASRTGIEQPAPARPVTPPADPTPKPRPAASPRPAPGDAAALVAKGDVAGAARAGVARARDAAAGSYTLQVLVACKPGTVTRAFRAVNDDRLNVTPFRYSGRDCWRLTWGTYADRGAAAAAAGEVPETFRKDGKPRPVAVADTAGR